MLNKDFSHIITQIRLQQKDKAITVGSSNVNNSLLTSQDKSLQDPILYLQPGDLLYAKKQMFHKKKNQQRMQSISKTNQFIKNQTEGDETTNSENFVTFFKSKSPPLPMPKQIESPDKPKTDNDQTFPNSNSTRAGYAFTNVEHNVKHKHVYEFLRNAVKKFDPTNAKKVPQIPIELWQHLNNNQQKTLNLAGNSIHIKSYESKIDQHVAYVKNSNTKLDSKNVTQLKDSSQKEAQSFWQDREKDQRFKKRKKNLEDLNSIIQNKKIELKTVNNLPPSTAGYNERCSSQGKRESYDRPNKTSQQRALNRVSNSPDKQTRHTANNNSIEVGGGVASNSNKNNTFRTFQEQRFSMTQPIIKEVVLTLSIPIYHYEVNKVKESKINKMLEFTNTLIKLAAKAFQPINPTTNNFTQFEIKTLKRAGIAIPKNVDYPSFIKSREFFVSAREKALSLMTQELQIVNKIPSKTNSDINFSTQYAKFFVGYGNNFPLVRQILKNRWWMSMGEKANFDECHLVWTSWRKQKITEQLQKYEDYLSNEQANKFHVKKVYARIEDNFHLTNKKGLLINMQEYYRLKGSCVFANQIFPHTFLIKNGFNDEEYYRLKNYHQENPGSIWIVKPGENSNRGCGITLCSNINEINKSIEEIRNSYINTNPRTLIVQNYIKNPLLIHKRKFDIRVYGMLATNYGGMKGYFYEDGYLRTSSKEFSLNNLQNKYIHLTNDAIQKRCDDYGKFENGNKLSYSDFQKYLESNDFLQSSKYSNVNFFKDILPQIKHLVTESFRSVAYQRIDPYKRVNSFEIFGFDFMIDEDFAIYLIEANTNPCIEINQCPVLARIIPQMLECAFRIAVDPLLPPPDLNFKRGQEYLQENKFSQVFDYEMEYEELHKLYRDENVQQENILKEELYEESIDEDDDENDNKAHGQ